MIKKTTLDFLKKLGENNNREWFQAHKNLYEEARKNIEETVNHLIMEVSVFDPAIIGMDAKDMLFRIYRDVRFSKDKSPYKPYFGAMISKNGKSDITAGGYYFHIEPGNSIVCGGVYHPDPATLYKVREKINRNFKKFIGIIDSQAFKKYFSDIEGEKLKTVLSDGFLKEVVKRILAVREFNEFLTV